MVVSSLESTKANKFHKLPSHAWSVVVVGPHDAEALRFKNKTEVIDIIFYTTQHDAMECESAYLVGKRPDKREADTQPSAVLALSVVSSKA